MSKNDPIAVVHTTVLSDEKLGVVTVQATADLFSRDDGDYNGYFKAVGSAKATADDKFDPAIGAALATSRALKDLSKQIARSVHDEVHKRDKTRKHQQEASEAAAARAKRRRQASARRRKAATKATASK